MCVIKRPILTDFVHQQAQAGQTDKAKKRKRKVEPAASDTKHDTAAAVRDLFCNLWLEKLITAGVCAGCGWITYSGNKRRCPHDG